MVEKLSIKERMTLLSGGGRWHTNDLNGKLDTVYMSDGPHGLRAQSEKIRENNRSCEATCFPTASALAASWDTELVAKVAFAIADEAKAEGTTLLLGPGVNMKRSPLCGRNFEYFSEDPYLTGTLAAAYVNAVQAKGVGTSLKHFACNSQERLRMRENSQVDERTLNEIYLRAFEITVKKAQPATVMASYNRVNGDYACMNRELLTDILRERWGFEGAVISDWGACLDLVRSVKAGMDLEMPGNSGEHLEKLYEAFDNGEITEAEIDRAAKNLLKLIDIYGGSGAVLQDEKGRRELLCRNHEIAVKAAEECAVLLKNDGILPLTEDQELTVIGDLAVTPRIQGGGSSHINTSSCENFLEVLNKAGIKYSFERGYDHTKDSVNGNLESRALELIKKSKGVVLFFGGLTDITEGEGYDRETLYMPENQIGLLKKIRKLNKDLIFVSFGGSPYDMAPADFARAVLHMYLGGEGVSVAAKRLLYGEAEPQGKLAESFPVSIISTPVYGNYSTRNEDIRYNEGLFIGYRYYDAMNIDVAYPFGFGLSYTTFDYSKLEAGSNIKSGEKVKVKFNITNTGSRAGSEIVQVYVENKTGNIMRPVRELRGFAKVPLQPGETKQVEIELDENAFSVFDVTTHRFRPVAGKYFIAVGASSRDLRLRKEVNVSGEDCLCIPGFPPQPHLMDDSEFAALFAGRLSDFSHVKPGGYDLSNSLDQLSEFSVRARVLRFMAKRVGRIMFFGKSKRDPEVRMFTETVADGPLDLLICHSGGALKMKWAEKIVDSANRKSLKEQKSSAGRIS